MARAFNDFFVTVASDLVKKLQKGTGRYGIKQVEQFYAKKGAVKDSFGLSKVKESDICKILKDLNAGKATGLDNLSARFVNDAAEIIACPLTNIINISIQHGVFPNDLKLARVIPIYKKNNKTEVGNYRPVSILNVFSKVLERVVHDQLYKYLHEANLFYTFQSGFRESFSTDSCLLHLTDIIRMEMDKGNLTGMILLDLQKAFDTVNHTILIKKLKALGLNISALNWFTSYLSDRKQLVNISGVTSGFEKITCGVPQGSIIGPLLF